MIFQHTIDLVLNKTKTQTRRIVKPGDYVWSSTHTEPATITDVWNVNHRPRWIVGNTYAVQPGRTQKAVARIRILDIRREDVRSISWEDTQAEGFTNKVMFFNTWLQMHDPSIYEIFRDYKLPYDGIKTASELIDSRPANRYDAWALTFELVA